MGAQEFYSKVRATSMSEAYSKAQEEAEAEYGHQEGYSGQINSTHGCKDVTEDFKLSGKSLEKFGDSFDKQKGLAYGICIEAPIENTAKVKTKVEHIVQKGTKKWILVYDVEDFDEYVGSRPSKGEAVKLARQHTEKTRKTTTISMSKKLETGSADVAKVCYKASKRERIGEYVFFGEAPC